MTQRLLAAAAILALVIQALIAAGVRGPALLNDFAPSFTIGLAAALALWWAGRDAAIWRRTAIAALSTLGLIAIVNYAAQSVPIVTDSDIAVSELYVELASRGQLLVGAYSRFGWHHPGPLLFYAIAPFYAASGHEAAALYAVALAINIAAITAIAAVSFRSPHRPLAAALGSACLLFAWRADRFLASPWNAHAGVLPSLAFVVTAAAVLAGRTRPLPLLVIFGSFAAQAHVGFVPLVATLGLAVLFSLVARRNGDTPATQTWLGSAALLVALWTPVMVDAATNHGGNAAALWQFFAGGGAGHSWREAILAGGYGLAGVFRPDFELAWGGHVEIGGAVWTTTAATAMVLLLIWIAVADLAAGRRFGGMLALAALAASVIGVWGLTRVRDDILNHDLFRIAAIGALDAGVIAGAAIRTIAARWRSIAWPDWLPSLAAAAAVALVVATGVLHLESFTSFERRQRRAQIPEAHHAVRVYLGAEKIARPLIRIGNDRWSDAAGVLIRLVQDGRSVAVTDDMVSMFTERFRATGAEDARITFADLELHRTLRVVPDNQILLQAFPLFVDAERVR